MGMKSCITFREIDELFINYKANEEQFSSEHGLYNKYCPGKNGSKICETDYEKLNAIFGYAYTELAQNNMMDLDNENDLSADFLIMGLSNILYKLSKDQSLSLKDAFKKYLSSQGSFNYSSILYNKKYFSGSNIGIMNGFYFLFQQICETINRYNKSNAQKHEHIADIAQCYIIYDTLYNFVYRCGPYLQLFNHLKTIYDEFIDAVIKVHGNDEALHSNLKKLSSIDTTKFKSEFNSKGCKKLHEKLTTKTPQIIRTAVKMLDDVEKRKNGDGSQSTGDDENEDLNLDDEEGDEEEDDDDEEDDDEEDGDDEDGKDIVDGGEKKDDTIDNMPVNQEDDPGNISDQSSVSNDGPSQPKSGTPNNTDDSNHKEPTLENRQSSDKSPESSSDTQPTKETTQENQGTTQKTLLMKKESIVDALKVMRPTANMFRPYFLSFYNTLTDIGNNAYKKTLQTLQNTSSKLIEFASELNNAINQPNKVTVTPPQGDNGPKPEGSESDPPPSDDPSTNIPPVPHSSQNSQTEPTKQSGTEHKQDEGPKEKDQQQPLTIQGPSDGSINTSYVQATKPYNSESNINGIISKSVISMDIFKKHKLTAVSVIGIAIPITLAIMYKYLSFGWRKEMKRKKNMKRVINSIGGKRPVQIIINSSSQKKQTKKSINSVYKEKSPLLNIYKLMQADPIPFINLFFLLTFFVYKRKYDYLEL
ncbi:PIR protein CIR protein [Plasmodium vinckei lentum]|uniref:PIR protein CIR protein n=1 Tax=Plasmodium vinckei lentum TaxID=138297 RepID=A0A6V7S586_PLAVN|nr:PIR protein CIR protein [Plasmodium vinckei lentum]